jgi:hypothetical protein
VILPPTFRRQPAAIRLVRARTSQSDRSPFAWFACFAVPTLPLRNAILPNEPKSPSPLWSPASRSIPRRQEAQSIQTQQRMSQPPCWVLAHSVSPPSSHQEMAFAKRTQLAPQPRSFLRRNPPVSYGPECAGRGVHAASTPVRPNLTIWCGSGVNAALQTRLRPYSAPSLPYCLIHRGGAW